MVVYTCPLDGNGSLFVVTVNNHYTIIPPPMTSRLTVWRPDMKQQMNANTRNQNDDDSFSRESCTALVEDGVLSYRLL